MTDLGGEREGERMVAMTADEGREGLGRDSQGDHGMLAISVQTCVKRMIRTFSWRTRRDT